ncbi:haloacid dehalogenase superfamily, subfamily IA, variant 3 with third motif having DD or ED [Tranquillimonas rosea]|uniref:Haloacid dehalogenase superfamily, subfamily IA, variant 3 with third motif having DD or ED n=1 Tax=Tranquillimonas rosea TaxID=641238 RepID=A0A1H9TGB5_9RHOB|nr:HAD-IA family hydrolase [Tranquillimonas rosea]SER96168.1 haloacid dehalogenase superfamily, subfamily IA, variant 3 with third motif having DD or ED [Tranquillimonas rosea]
MAAALLFDLDGTLLDTDPIHAAVFREVFAARDREISEGFYADHIHGRLNADIFAEYFPDEDPQAVADEKEAAFRARLGDSAAPMPGLPGLISRAQREGWRLAVVTNAPRLNAEAMLGAIGMADTFEAVVIGDDLRHGKPHPEPYLAAMDRLGVAARDCIAFEDSRSGVESASAAGAHTIGIRSTLSDDQLRHVGAAATIADFEDPALSTHLERLTGVIP